MDWKLPALLLAIFLAGCTSTSTGDTGDQKELPADFSLSEDLQQIQQASSPSECVKVPTNYCGCANGGEFAAINADYEDAYMEWHEVKSPEEPVNCLAVYQCYNYTVTVEDGRCNLEAGELKR